MRSPFVVSFAFVLVVACGPGPYVETATVGQGGPAPSATMSNPPGSSPITGLGGTSPTPERSRSSAADGAGAPTRSRGPSGSDLETATSEALGEPPGAKAPPPVVNQGDPGPDPKQGNFTLADATVGLAGSGKLVATINTSMGSVSCKLLDDKAPNTVANFVGLARGLRPWLDSTTRNWVTKPIYDGTIFHRIIKGFMIQGGDPLGNGRGEPGYVIKDEIWPGATHDRAGLLCMANRGPNTNGAQFFITDAKALFLDKNYTIFGECSPESVIHTIASVPTEKPGDKPLKDVVIKSVTIAREGGG